MTKYTQKYPIAILVLLGAVIRIGFGFLNNEIILRNDSSTYLDLAQLISSGSIRDYFGGRSPGYPLLIAALGNSTILIVVLQSLLGIISSVIWYKILRYFQSGIVVSVCISLFFSSFLQVLSYENTILIETVNLFFITLLMYCILKNKIGYATFCLTFLVLLKPFYIYLPFVVLVYFVYNNRDWKVVLKKYLQMVIFPILAFISWSYVNFVNTGYFVSSTYFGLNKIQVCVNFIEKAPEEYKWIKTPYLKQRKVHSTDGYGNPMCIWYAVDNGAFDYKRLSFPQLSAEFGKCADVTIKNNFGSYLKQVVLLSFKEFWNVEKVIPDSVGSSLFLKYLWKSESILLRIIKTIFLLLIPVYCFEFLKNKRFTVELLLVLIVLSTAILQAMVSYGSNARYSFPFEFIMITLVLLSIENKFFAPKK